MGRVAVSDGSVTGIRRGVRSVRREVDGKRRLIEAEEPARCGPAGGRDRSESSADVSSSGSENEVRRCTPKKVVAIYRQIW